MILQSFRLNQYEDIILLADLMKIFKQEEISKHIYLYIKNKIKNNLIE